MSAIAFIGLGRMGLPMARRVLAAGHSLVVYNRMPGRATPLVAEGAVERDTPRAAARGAEFVITMVSDAAAAEAVYLGADGALADLEPGAVALDMSTIGPAAARRLAAAATERGIGFLDAPVSGSTATAAAGQLTAMVGGPAETLERARPVLSAMTKAQYHLGPAGAGAAMKLALNTVIALTNQAIAECLVLAEAAGIAPATAYEVLANSAVASPFVAYKRAAFLAPESTPAAFTTDLMRKDLALALDLAREVRVQVPATRATADALALASRQGLGDADMASIASALRRLAAGCPGS